MLARHLLAPIGTLVLVAAVPGLASAAPTWNTSGSGAATAKGGTLTAPTSVAISSCTGTKSSGTVSGTVTLTWTVSTSAQATGQKVYIGSGSPTTYTLNSTIANNTTASETVNYGPVSAGTYRVGVAATRGGAWLSTIAGSSDTFAPTTSGPTGGCSAT